MIRTNSDVVSAVAVRMRVIVVSFGMMLVPGGGNVMLVGLYRVTTTGLVRESPRIETPEKAIDLTPAPAAAWTVTVIGSPSGSVCPSVGRLVVATGRLEAMTDTG